jgi:hypothetical protein
MARESQGGGVSRVEFERDERMLIDGGVSRA